MKKKENRLQFIVDCPKRTLCLLLRHRVLKLIPLALSMGSPLACITGGLMLPTASTGCVSLERFAIFSVGQECRTNISRGWKSKGPKFRPIKLSGRCVARHQRPAHKLDTLAIWPSASEPCCASTFLFRSHIDGWGLHPTGQHIRHRVVCSLCWRDHRCLFVWLFCCGPSSSPNVWLRPTDHL